MARLLLILGTLGVLATAASSDVLDDGLLRDGPQACQVTALGDVAFCA